jgi:hypothetical protein
MHVAHFDKVLTRVRLLDACVGKVPKSQREFVFPRGAEPEPERDVVGEVEARGEPLLVRLVEPRRRRRADADLGEPL